MILKDIQELLGAQLVGSVESLGREVQSCYASDLISDVLTFHGQKSLLLTGLTNAQVIRTAEILDFVAICFVRGKEPQPETARLAQQNDVPLLVTDLTMYESCGRLYARGLLGPTRSAGS